MKMKRKFNLEFKRELVENIKAGVMSMAQAIRQHELGYALIHGWMDRYERGKLNNEASEAGEMKNKIAELERKVGQQAMEIDLLKKAREHYVRNLSEKSSAPSPKEVSANGAKS